MPTKKYTSTPVHFVSLTSVYPPGQSFPLKAGMTDPGGFLGLAEKGNNSLKKGFSGLFFGIKPDI